MARKQQIAGPRLAHSVREAAEITPFGYERLLGFINAGELPARRNRDADGNPVGPFVILHADLVKFLENLPVA